VEGTGAQQIQGEAERMTNSFGGASLDIHFRGLSGEREEIKAEEGSKVIFTVGWMLRNVDFFR
jgi:hypothetical protein